MKNPRVILNLWSSIRFKIARKSALTSTVQCVRRFLYDSASKILLNSRPHLQPFWNLVSTYTKSLYNNRGDSLSIPTENPGNFSHIGSNPTTLLRSSAQITCSLEDGPPEMLQSLGLLSTVF